MWWLCHCPIGCGHLVVVLRSVRMVLVCVMLLSGQDPEAQLAVYL